MDMAESEYLAHYGILRRSGRYPWGSGGSQSSRNKSFLQIVDDLRKQGFSEVDIAKQFDITTTQLRAAKTIAKTEQQNAKIAMAQRLKEKGYSNGAIAQRMNLPSESSVRALLAPGVSDRNRVLKTTANMLKEQVAQKTYLDVGSGVENLIGVTRTKLDAAIALLKEEGYELHPVKIRQAGTGLFTNYKVLVPPGITSSDVYRNRDFIRTIQEFSEDGGLTFLGIHPPLSISSKRVGIAYKEDGGDQADGVIFVRPGVKDVSIGNAHYAQVRIMVDGSHYLKGMAVYKEDLPAGVDLLFNTNKSDTGSKHDAMKAIKDDPDNPFGATIRQITGVDSKGNVKITSAMNIVGTKEGAGEEGSWDTWSKSLSSQFLSKQSPALAKSQLDMSYESRKSQLDEILALTNPAVKRKLLMEFADEADSSAVHLHAAQLPRQANRVILPINSMKPGEVYAPSFRNGERVALIRHPHGGTFEIPELTVNNKNPEAIRIIGNDPNKTDAIGIHHSVAKRLSGADFDGDTVLVIPNNEGRVKSTPALEGLKDFDTNQYRLDSNSPIPRMTSSQKQKEMGNVSNLITDMTIKAANTTELARAIRHSMVVIDAEKHHLDWKRSAQENGIASLKEKYQGGKRKGASTLISRATSEKRVVERRARRASEGGPIDVATGRKVFVPTGRMITDRRGRLVPATFKSTKLAETTDAHTLVSDKGGTRVEHIYADHSNRLKTLANEARKAAVAVRPAQTSVSAKTHYSSEVASLESKLNAALRNRPLERQAQVFARAKYLEKIRSNPEMDDATLKKIKFQALQAARNRVGAKAIRIEITDREWEAIQAGAISNNKLKQILDKADPQRVKELATPRTRLLMTGTKLSRARGMASLGYTQAEIADALGVSLTTLKNSLGGG